VSDTLPSLAERANAPLPLDTFVLEQAVLEIRYDNAYIFWDRSGRLWQEMVKAEEDLRPLETQLNRLASLLHATISYPQTLKARVLMRIFQIVISRPSCKNATLFFRSCSARWTWTDSAASACD
jgi:hypothetical protein